MFTYNADMLTLWVVIGLLSGLLVNYLADVLPTQRRLAVPLWWPLRAAKVAAYLTTRAILVFAFLLGVGIAVYQFPADGFSGYLLFSIIAYFTLITVIDYEHRLVLHPISILGVLLMGGIGLMRHGLANTLLGGAVGFGLMLVLYFLGDWLGRMMARSRGEPWEETALGFGDVNLSGVIGLLMGWPGVIAALFAGVFAAGIFSALYLVWMMVRRKYSVFSSFAYAPFLSLGTVVMILVGLYFT